MKCSFCGKTQKEVRRLVQADTGAVICDECVVEAVIKMIRVPIKTVRPNDIINHLKDALPKGRK